MVRTMLFPRLFLILASMALPLTACTMPQQRGGMAQPPLAQIQQLLPGDYVGKTSRRDVYHSIAALDVPAFGGRVFYHHISVTSLRGPAAQRKIYVFDESGAKMRSTVVLGSGAVFTDAQTMAQTLNALTEDQLLRFPDGCQFQWTARPGGFTATVSREECSYDSPAFGGMVSPEMTYQLSACVFAVREGIYRADGSPVFPPSASDNQRVGAAPGAC